MAWAVALVARRARIVALLSSMSEAGSSPVSSLASFLAWKTWSTAIECSAEAVCPAAEYARLASADVALHGLDRWLALAFHPIAVGGQRCASTDSSRGGRCSYPFSSAPSTDVRAAKAEERMRDQWGCATISWARMNFRGRRGTSVGGGLIVPREKTLVQPAARWLVSGDHSSPSSLTAFVMIRMSSSSALSLALREEDNGKRAGSVTEPDNSSVSKATRKKVSSISPSLAQNEIISLIAKECWSCWVKRTGECSLPLRWRRGTWALSRLELACHRTLKSSACCFFLTDLWASATYIARRPSHFGGLWWAA